MNSLKEWIGITLFLGGIILMFALIPIRISYMEGYKKGQVEAALGIQNYYLKTLPDSTKRWERKGILERDTIIINLKNKSKG